MIEWQNKQYTPWHYYTKGKTIPGISGEGNLRLKAIVITIIGILVISGSVLGIISSILYRNRTLSITCILVIGICVWDISVHWNKYNRQKAFIEMKREKQNRQRKKWKKKRP